MWKCPHCETINRSELDHCEHCAAPAPGLATAAPSNAATAASDPLDGAPPDAASAPRPLVEHPAFPNLADAASLRPKRSQQSLIVGALVLAVALSAALTHFTPAESMLHRIFGLDQVDGWLTPLAISVLFFWGLLTCLQRHRAVGALAKVTSAALVAHANSILRTDGGVQRLAHELSDPRADASPLLRRLRAVTTQWVHRPHLQDANLVLQEHVAIDEESMHRGYTLVRVFVWALPVLGLIGTVWGISEAVGGFASFLGGDIEDVTVIKKSLVGVTGGLSFAFLITLQGLLASLVLMFLSSALQASESKVYSELQQKVADSFLPVLQQCSAEVPPSGSPSHASSTTIEQLLVAMNDRMGDAPAAFLAHAKTFAGELAHELRAHSSAAAAVVRQAFDRHGAATESIAAAMENTARAVAGLQSTVLGQTTALRDGYAEVARRVELAESRISEHVQLFAALGRTGENVLEQHALLRESLDGLRALDLGTALTAFGTNLTQQSQHVHGMVSAVGELAASMRDVHTAQNTLLDATSRFNAMELHATLHQLRQSLGQMEQVLGRFQQPFVLQAVPLPSTGQAQLAD